MPGTVVRHRVTLGAALQQDGGLCIAARKGPDFACLASSGRLHALPEGNANGFLLRQDDYAETRCPPYPILFIL